MIDKKISVSEQVANLPERGQLIFTWAIPHADDVGILPYSPRTLKAMIVPLIDMKQEEFNEHLDQIIKAGLFRIYEHCGKKFIAINQFLNFQILKKDRRPQTLLDGVDTWDKAEALGFISSDLRAEYSGETHHNWKGGVTPENAKIRNSPEYSKWRLEVFERDKFTCKKCGEAGGKLEAHHIKSFADFPELRFEVKNGKTLCEKCHAGIHRKPDGNQKVPMSSLREDKRSKGKVSKESNISAPTFDIFWAEYPNKVSHKKAKQIWEKLMPDEELFEKIMAGLSKAKKSSQWLKDGGTFIPHPTTWLNQERWNDEGGSITGGRKVDKF